ncbi:MAG TPA: hypothetical protein VGF73_09245, partial [Chthoniobacterales bacterium]
PMRRSRNLHLLLAALLCLTNGICFAGGKERSTSTSRQFLVYGADVQVRGAICDLAEEMKSNLLRLLDLHDDWKTPLVVNLEYPQANLPDVVPAPLEVSQLGYGLKLQLNLFVTKTPRTRATEESLLRAILLEFMYRDRGNVPAGTPYVTPPDWLIAGVLGLEPERSSDADAELLQTVVAANKIQPLDEVVIQRRAQLDLPSQTFFDAYSRALVELLLDAPDGHAKLTKYLSDLPIAPNDAMADLRVHFPDTLARSPSKWWALSVARLSATDRFEILTAAQTAEQLDRVLHFSIPAPGGKEREYSLGDYEKFMKLPGYKPVLQLVSRQLLLLSSRSHPSYRPIVQEDYQLADLIAHGRTHRLDEHLARVASYRDVVEKQATAIDDYLNWYEATQIKAISGAFTQMLEEPKTNDASSRRRDPISVYLDSVEMEME